MCHLVQMCQCLQSRWQDRCEANVRQGRSALCVSALSALDPLQRLPDYIAHAAGPTAAGGLRDAVARGLCLGDQQRGAMDTRIGVFMGYPCTCAPHRFLQRLLLWDDACRRNSVRCVPHLPPRCRSRTRGCSPELQTSSIHCQHTGQ